MAIEANRRKWQQGLAKPHLWWYHTSRSEKQTKTHQSPGFNAGFYRCVVSNCAGTETSQCTNLVASKHNIYCEHNF